MPQHKVVHMIDLRMRRPDIPASCTGNVTDGAHLAQSIVSLIRALSTRNIGNMYMKRERVELDFTLLLNFVVCSLRVIHLRCM